MGHRGDGRKKTGTGDEILETGRDTVDRTVVLETENRRRLTGDKTGDRRPETEDRRQEKEDRR